ncbi:MAG: recombinase family protein [Balneola sp.]|nr:MAG: recombinase family protein [Balneola sp.]
MENQSTPKVYSYIRISTGKQREGDGLRRQTEDIDYEKIAKSLDLPLDNELKLVDEGFSGFTGENRTKGALGYFETLINDGKIAEGSVLVIEMLDRLTRQALLEAVHLMTGILLKGVGIYTAADKQYYTKDTFDVGQLVLSAIILQTGHEESLKKTIRGRANWRVKREKSEKGEEKLSKICPLWLEPVTNKNGKTISFKIKKDIAAEVRMMFQLKLEGLGNKRIADRLTRNWPPSTIQRYIHDRRVLGEYQPHSKQSGKRKEIGNKIINYYPPIVEKELFEAVQEHILDWKERHGYHVGRNGSNGVHSNVFVKIVKCGECGSAMHYDNKGDTSKGGKYLRCYSAKRALKDENGNRICRARSVRYQDFFELFFKYIEEVDLSKFINDKDELKKQISENELKISAEKFRVRQLEDQVSNLIDTISTTRNKVVRNKLELKIEKIIEEQTDLSKVINNLNLELYSLRNESKKLKSSQKEITKAREYLETATSEEEKINRRKKLHQLIGNVVNGVEIYPRKEPYVRNMPIDEPGVIVHMESRYIKKFKVIFNTKERNNTIVTLKRYRVPIKEM